jgi:hypothetical protein
VVLWVEMSSFVLTGNATVDGRPLWRDADGGWTHDVRGAVLFTSEDARARALEQAHREQAVVCDPYFAAAERVDGEVRPATLKERIRATGPTVSHPT